MSFEEEMKKQKNPYIRKIGEYLLSRDDIQDNLNKQNKSLDEMYKYIRGEARKKSIGGCAMISDEEVYEMAVHYYDEDEIKISNPTKSVQTNKEYDDEISKIRNSFKDKKVEKAPYQVEKKKTKKKEKKKVDANQMSIFDL